MKRWLILLAALVPLIAWAQGFPSRPIKMVTPYSTGIGPDLYMRALGELLQREWGQPVVVEAKPGGNGFIAVEQVKKAAPDGHELLVLANSHLTINPSLYRKLPYDPEKDFVPVALVIYAWFFVTVATNGPSTS